jgi:hypothetical protein
VAIPQSPYSASELRARSKLLQREFPAPESGDDPLNAVIEEAQALVGALTCRSIRAGSPGAAVPDDLVPIAVRAVRLKAEQVGMGEGADVAEESALGRRLRSQSAGPWSESYFGPGDLQVKGGRPVLDPNASLDEALWALMTDACKERILEEMSGQVAPAGQVTPFNYGERTRRVY